MANPKIEAAIVVPTGGWSCELRGDAVTVAAGTYYPTTLVAAFDAAAKLVDAGYSAAIGATGLVTIAHSGEFAITWTSAGLKSALGFSGAQSGASSYTATTVIDAWWLSPCGMTSRHGSGRGLPETTCGTSIAPTGATIRRRFATRYPVAYVFPAVKGRYTRATWETVAGESFETVWIDYLSTGATFRLFPDSSSGTYRSYVCTDAALRVSPVVEGWEGALSVWQIELDAEEQP